MLRVPPLRLSGVAVACCLMVVFSIAVKPVTDNDFWWHLATGRYMVEHHLIPGHDVFSLTAQDHRWITHEWLTELLFYAGWSLGGARLLMVAAALVITCTFGLVYLAARERDVPPLLAAPIVLLAALASAHTWGTRPQMLSLLLTAIYGLALVQMVTRRRTAPPLWFAGLMVLWVNLHGGFIFGLVLLAIATFGYVVHDLVSAAQSRSAAQAEDVSAEPLAMVSGMRGMTYAAAPAPAHVAAGSMPRVDLRRCLLVLVLTVLATLLNPNGLRGALYPISYLGNNASTRYIAEWVSPDFHKVQYLFFEGLVLALLVGALLNRSRASLTDVLLELPFTFLAFQSVRNISLFAVIVAPVAAYQVATALPIRWQAGRTNRPLQRARVVLNWLCVLAIGGGVAVATLGKTTDAAQAKAVAKMYPAAALRYITAHGLPARGFDSYNWGGYLIWNWFPVRQIYVDGRPDMYGDHFMDGYVRAYNGEGSWRDLFRRDLLCYALVEPSSGIAAALRTTSGWQLRYSDSVAVLFEMRTPPRGCSR